VSVLSSMLTLGLLEPKEPSNIFVASYQQPSAAPVEFHNYKDSVMRAAGILQILRNSAAGQGDYLDLVHSDYMDLKMISRGRLVW
jgi:hypothetical protein